MSGFADEMSLPAESFETEEAEVRNPKKNVGQHPLLSLQVPCPAPCLCDDVQ